MNPELSTNPPTVTFHYRLFQYINGLNETVYRAQEKGGLFGTWSWVSYRSIANGKPHWVDCDLRLNPHKQWKTKERAIETLTSYSCEQLDNMILDRKASQGSRLKLVVCEDLPITVSRESRKPLDKAS